MTEYKLGDYVRIHDHDATEITVKITDSGVPNRHSDFMFKAGARMFKHSEILGPGEVPVVNNIQTFHAGDTVFSEKHGHGEVLKASPGNLYCEVMFTDGYKKRAIEPRHLVRSKFPNTARISDTEVHADLVAENEAVKHPAHYGGADDPYEAIKVIEAWGLNFNLGSVLKYVRRAGKKDASKELEDLHKARFYIDHEISRVEQAK